jgi:hypothetical protein
MKRAGQFQNDELFSGKVYVSPYLSKDYMKELITTLRAKPGFSVQCNKPESWFLNN